jgi:hypothetical protein
MVIGGIDAPPLILEETDAEWLQRRRQELVPPHSDYDSLAVSG